MKKGLIFTTASVVVAAFIFTASCKKATNCATLVTEVSAAGLAYVSDTSATACKAYKAAVTAWLSNSDCVGNDATQKATYDAIIADLNTECP